MAKNGKQTSKKVAATASKIPVWRIEKNGIYLLGYINC